MGAIKAEGYWTCFACGGKRTITRYGKDGKEKQVRPNMRTLELRKTKKFGKNKGKPGKILGKATVCQLCFDDGHTIYPTIGNKGYVKYKEMPDNIKQVIADSKKKWGDKVEIPEQGATPSYPQSVKPAPLTPSSNEHKPQEK